jgi:hypothetical protein
MDFPVFPGGAIIIWHFAAQDRTIQRRSNGIARDEY